MLALIWGVLGECVMRHRSYLLSVSLCFPFFASGVVLADASPAAVMQLMTKELVGSSGKEVLMSTVTYPPGGASPPHRHDAQVFVYVLEGELVMQVQGGPNVTLKPGETFYESPSDVHAVSANASQTAPAKFLVFIIKDKGAPTTRAASP